ncbi:MAG: hypothetical protein B0D91_11125 [Oceanospirillales bacterium LUC14_002_19_P2]|nr:MAG: hypothetical protein B0D91_11125 [Oceanospirillales bacterium LUC14_002_19_P2]
MTVDTKNTKTDNPPQPTRDITYGPSDPLLYRDVKQELQDYIARRYRTVIESAEEEAKTPADREILTNQKYHLFRAAMTLILTIDDMSIKPADAEAWQEVIKLAFVTGKLMERIDRLDSVTSVINTKQINHKRALKASSAKQAELDSKLAEFKKIYRRASSSLETKSERNQRLADIMGVSERTIREYIKKVLAES